MLVFMLSRVMVQFQYFTCARIRVVQCKEDERESVECPDLDGTGKVEFIPIHGRGECLFELKLYVQ